jgi:hypothetical protein
MKNKTATTLGLTLFLFAAFTPALVNAMDPASTLTLEPTADSYVDSVLPNGNFGTEPLLLVKTLDQKQVYLLFELPPTISNTKIESAILTLNCPDLGTESLTVSANRINELWTENTLTYNNKPAAQELATASFITELLTPVTLDLTTDVQSFVNGETTNHGWRLTIDMSETIFYSKETIDTALRPTLTIIYGPSLQVPEYALGTLLAIAACFTALAIVKRDKIKFKHK